MLFEVSAVCWNTRPPNQVLRWRQSLQWHPNDSVSPSPQGELAHLKSNIQPIPTWKLIEPNGSSWRFDIPKNRSLFGPLALLMMSKGPIKGLLWCKYGSNRSRFPAVCKQKLLKNLGFLVRNHYFHPFSFMSLISPIELVDFLHLR